MRNLLLILSICVLESSSCSENAGTGETATAGESEVAAETPKTEPMAPSTPAAEPAINSPTPFTAEGRPAGDQKVEITTDYGIMIAVLYDETPKHKENFLKLVREGFYNDLLFHRVLDNFMIQGGDPESRNAPPGKQLGNGDVGYKISAEIKPHLIHKKGALAAARDQNPQMASSGCQFYIVKGQVITEKHLDGAEMMNKIPPMSPLQRQTYSTIGGTPHLDGTYTVFGEVIQGLDVIDKISAVSTNALGLPNSPVKMKIRILK